MARSLSNPLCITKRFTKMKNLTKQYDLANNKAKEFMKNGQISQYFEALLEVNRYKKLMTIVVSN